MKPRWFLAGTTVVLLLAGPFAVSVRAQTGVIEDLGTLGIDSFARGVNASGQAAGHSLATATRSLGFVTIGQDLQAIPTFGGNESSGRAISDSGVVAGFALDASGHWRAFRFDPAADSVPLDLGGLGGSYAFAYGINSAGAIVGYAQTADGGDEAFIWTGGSMQSLGSLGEGLSYAYGINDSNQVVGESFTADGTFEAFLYSQGVMQRLGTLGGFDSAAHAINDSGAVAGWSQIAGFGTRAFRYTPGLGMQELPTLGGANAVGDAIAPDGTVVGYSITPLGHTHACLWTPAGDVVDLNDRIDPSLGWVLVAATGINGNGQIVGYGQLNGAVRAFRLTLPIEAAPAAPTIHSVTATPSSLWPANNKLVTVHVTVDATDASGATPPCEITGATSSEQASGDIVMAGPLELQLRATRLGTGSGRTYRIDVACGSSPDALATSHVDVMVPKSRTGGARR